MNHEWRDDFMNASTDVYLSNIPDQRERDELFKKINNHNTLPESDNSFDSLRKSEPSCMCMKRTIQPPVSAYAYSVYECCETSLQPCSFHNPNPLDGTCVHVSRMTNRDSDMRILESRTCTCTQAKDMSEIN